MRYFHVLSMYLTPERFASVTEITSDMVSEYKKKDGYIKALTQEEALNDKLLLKHFTKKQIEESYEQ